MNIKIFAFIIVSLILVIFLKPVNPSISKLLVFSVCIILALSSIETLAYAINFIKALSQKANFNNIYLRIIIKCTAICFLGNFVSNLCKDNGENTLSFSTEFICRCCVVVMSLPIYSDLLNWMLRLWENC